MMKKFTFTTLSVATLTALLALSQRVSADDAPVLTKAVLKTHTNDEDKDHDTGIYCTVKSEDGETTIAECKNADNSGDDGTQYKDNSDHEVALNIVADGIKKAACKHYKVHIWQHTNGHDTWRMKPSVVLKFSDGTNITAEGGNVELKNDGAATDFSAP